MRVGILTFHRAHNYGAVLQCYALQKVLKNLGHEVQVIDYRQPYIEDLYAVFSWRRLFFLLMRLHIKPVSYLKNITNREKSTLQYRHFRDCYLQVTKPCRSHAIPAFDCYVIGSDQVWSLHCTQRMDKVYWGQFEHPDASKIIGYGISVTQTSLKQIGAKIIQRYLTAFSALSFREKAVQEQIARMTKRKGELVLDPTLLLPANAWNELKGSEKEACVVVYLFKYRDNIKMQGIDGRIERLAQSLDCDVMDLSDNTVAPEDFVAYFRSARYVITNSFHGVAFSLLFEKPLYVIRCHDALDERYVNLLTLVGGEKMLVDADFSPVPQPVDYVLIREALAKWRKHSIDYLKATI